MDNDHGITGELREWFDRYTMRKDVYDELTAIADRIDAEHDDALQREHERAYDKGYDEGFASADDWLAQHEDAMAEHGWVKLPVDAEGKPWHIGDFTESGQLVYKMYLDVHGWSFYGLVNDIDPSIHRHHHEPTVEGLLRDFGVDIAHALDADPDATVPEATIAKYAAKLRLAGDAE